MALTLLPEEVLELIVQYFTLKDLLSCSAVCIDWREKFNNDTFWRKFCTYKNINYLENSPCTVKPGFVLPDQNEERLQPICSLRISFMMENHLFNNWKSEKFVCTVIRPYNDVVSCDVIYDCEGTHWMFIRKKCDIELWNINTKPQLYATIPLFPNCSYVCSFLAGKRAVITQWNICTVYDLKNHEKSLKSVCRFVLEESKPLDSFFWDSVDKKDTEQINVSDDFRFYTFGNVLVGHKRIPNPPLDLTMHIWDISSGKKLKVESMLNKLSNFKEVAFTNIFKIDENKGLIRISFISIDNEVYSQMFIYDFQRLKFADTNIMFEGVVAWCGCAQNIIVTFTSHPGTIKFFNSSSGNLISVKDIGIYTNSEQMQLVGSYLLYCMFNCMNVLDIHKQETVYCLEFSFYSFVRRLTVIEPRFVVVWLLERGGSPGCPSYHQEIWDMKNISNKLFLCSSELGFEMVTSSISMVKQVISCDGLMYLYTFW